MSQNRVSLAERSIAGILLLLPLALIVLAVIAIHHGVDVVAMTELPDGWMLLLGLFALCFWAFKAVIWFLNRPFWG